MVLMVSSSMLAVSAGAQDLSEQSRAAEALEGAISGHLMPTHRIEAWAGDADSSPSLDLEGREYRTNLRDGRRLAMNARCDDAIPSLARAAMSPHDDGRAATELARCARMTGELAVGRQAAFLAVRRARHSHPAIAAQALFELGRLYEDAGLPDSAIAAFVESLSLRTSEVVRRHLAGVRGRGEGLGAVRSHDLERGSAPCATTSDAAASSTPCRVVWQERDGAVTYAIAEIDGSSMESIEIDAFQTIEIPEGEIVYVLHVGVGDTWFIDEIGRNYAGDGGMGGTGGGVEVLHAELVDAVRGGARELSIELREHDVDFDWCGSYWQLGHATRVYGTRGTEGVLWADVTTSTATFEGPGRIAWYDESEDASLDEEWQSCDFERSPRTPEEWADVRLERTLPEPRFSLRFAEGAMSVRGVAPPSLWGVRDIRRLAERAARPPAAHAVN